MMEVCLKYDDGSLLKRLAYQILWNALEISKVSPCFLILVGSIRKKIACRLPSLDSILAITKEVFCLEVGKR